MSNYFTDKDEETIALIEKCTEGQNPEVKADYLVNCLTLKHLQNKTVKEIFEIELKAKEGFETELKNRNKS